MAQDARGLPGDADSAPPGGMSPRVEGMTQDDDVRPRRQRTSGRGGCCATCHRQQAQVIALLEALVLRGMPGHIPLTPEGYLEGLYQAAAERARRAGRGDALAP